MSNLQQRIEAIVPIITGWCTPAKAYDLALAVIKVRSVASLEVGVWGGKSCIPLGLAHQEQQFGKVFAVDPWSPVESVVGYEKVNADWWGSQNHEAVYQSFLENIKRHGLTDYIEVVRKKSDDFEPPKELGLVHLDGLHTDQAIRDVERFAPCVVPHGFFFADDIGWTGGGVGRAVEKLLSMGFVKVFDRDTGAMFQRVPVAKVVPKKRGRPPGKKVKKGSVRVVEA